MPRQSSARQAAPDSSPRPRKKPAKSSGLAANIGKITAALVAAAGLLTATEGFLNQAESLTCRKIWPELPWCRQKAPHQPSSSAGSAHSTADKPRLASERFLPLAGALDPERWSKLSGNGSYQFVDGKLHAQTHQGDALLLAKDSNAQQDFTYSMTVERFLGPGSSVTGSFSGCMPPMTTSYSRNATPKTTVCRTATAITSPLSFLGPIRT